ncbi:hypothetical protein SDC9_20881 [bioreactor metagenome]|uniref:PD-(D/E)XK endonuclease-like domain-containing protein n=1 Tax=bioreactor metagenome TaxID=1076179 RepID=A0A644U808_9ZZZZ|nr:hypothetical protein [Negativicutes bacterium]
MPANQFICVDGRRVAISDCLKACPMKERCMFLPTLRAVAQSLERGLKEATVTELLAGTRETYLKKTVNYAVRPQDVLYALHGSSFHNINDQHTEGDILSEIRLHDAVTSGKFDLYGKILSEDDGVLGDLKVTSSYKLMKALGIYKLDMPTGEVYKTGLRKGQEKTKKEFRYDGVKHVLDWAIQLNAYRRLLEKEGFGVKRMVIQALCRDSGLRITAERGIDKSLYLIPIYRISDRWLQRYFEKKSKALKESLSSHELPPVCKSRERWGDRKCLRYCAVAESCPHGQALLAEDTKTAG